MLPLNKSHEFRDIQTIIDLYIHRYLLHNVHQEYSTKISFNCHSCSLYAIEPCVCSVLYECIYYNCVVYNYREITENGYQKNIFSKNGGRLNVRVPANY